MPIALESGARFGRGAVPHQAPPPACGGGTSSAGRGSDSSAAAVHREESEEGDGEVQSSYRGPLETMDALQDALPRRSVPQSAANLAPPSTFVVPEFWFSSFLRESFCII